MTGRIQEASRGSAIHRQTRVLTRGACCDHLVVTYDIHTCEYIHSLSLSLSHLRSLTCNHYYCYFNYYLLFIIIYTFILIIKKNYNLKK